MMRQAGRFHAARAAIIAVLLFTLIGAGFMVRQQVIEQRRQLQADDLVKRLLDADIAQAPTVVAEIEPIREWVAPLLRQKAADPALKPSQKLNASLALISTDDRQIDYLFERLLSAEPQELLAIREALEPHRARLLKDLWAVVEKHDKRRQAQWLRAAAALAKYDPHAQQWTKLGPLVARDLAFENPIYLSVWSEAFRPVKESLFTPLSDIFRDPTLHTAERSVATGLLVDYAADRPEFLANLLLDADEREFAAVFPKFQEQADRAFPMLAALLLQKMSDDPTDVANEKLAKRQANAAVILAKLNQPDSIWPLLKHSSDPRARSYLIQRFPHLGGDAEIVARQLDAEHDISIRRALLFTLGGFDLEQLSPSRQREIAAPLLKAYRSDPDAGMHAASAWLLRKWGYANQLQAIDAEVAGQPAENRSWFVNPHRQTLVIIPGPVKFMMGSPHGEVDRDEGAEDKERLHEQDIARSFAIGMHDVTLADFLELRPMHHYQRTKSSPGGILDKTCPITDMSWDDAVDYCNRLSESEGIHDPQQLCYEQDASGKYVEAKDYLSRQGYRLPTGAEWEYASRAGAKTSRYYGETSELLPFYAWSTTTSDDKNLLPVGSLIPNDFGLFDMLGNAADWCEQDTSQDAKPGEPNATSARQPVWSHEVRGGSFYNRAAYIRSACRIVPYQVRTVYYGFRVAKTLP